MCEQYVLITAVQISPRSLPLYFRAAIIVTAGFHSFAVAQPDGPSATQPTPTTQGMPTPEAIEEEVYQNIIHQSVGDQGIPDFRLPEPFLRRVADHVVRDSYERRYRIVVQEGVAKPLSQGGAPASKPLGGMPITIVGSLIVLAVIGVWLVARRQST
jgi:hypothetical protein